MTVLKGKYKNINNNSKITICIGNFDGIHLGHQKLIKIIKSYKDSDPSIMTFHPHPKAFFNNEDFKYLSSQKDNEKILSEQGIIGMLLFFRMIFKTSKPDIPGSMISKMTRS